MNVCLQLKDKMIGDLDNIVLTIGVDILLHEVDTDLMRAAFERALINARDVQPDKVTDGGNDKDFFDFKWQGTKLWAVRNEVGGLTVMLPEEY